MSATIKMLLALPLSVTITYAQAQNTVGELLDAGAKKITKDQMVAGIAGTKVTGVTSSGRAEMNIDLHADGTLSGSVTSRQGGGTSGTVGKWSVDEAGKTCIDENLIAWNLRHQECFFSFRLGEQSYRTTSDSEDRDTRVVKSQVIVK